MFGDDPGTTVTTVLGGSGTTSGRAREEGRGLKKEVRLGLAVGSVLCRRPQAEKRGERRPGDCFWRPKTSDVRPVTIAAMLSVGASNDLRMR